jgi:hypothetical protein
MAWMVAPPQSAERVPGETFGHDVLEPFAG